MNDLSRAEFNVKGFVQGVGFRYYIYQQAVKLGLNGFAKNKYDGTVSVCVEGVLENINILEKQLWIGPSRSRVDKVLAVYQNYKGEFSHFEIG